MLEELEAQEEQEELPYHVVLVLRLRLPGLLPHRRYPESRPSPTRSSVSCRTPPAWRRCASARRQLLRLGALLPHALQTSGPRRQSNRLPGCVRHHGHTLGFVLLSSSLTGFGAPSVLGSGWVLSPKSLRQDSAVLYARAASPPRRGQNVLQHLHKHIFLFLGLSARQPPGTR